MREHRNPRQRLAKQPTPDNPTTAPTEPEPEPGAPAPAPEEPEPDPEADHLVCVLRDRLRRADSYITSAEKELVESWGGVGDDGGGENEGEDDDNDVQRRRCRVEDLVEAGKLAVREAQYTTDQLAAELAMQRRGGPVESVPLDGGVNLWHSPGALHPGPGLVLNRRVPMDPQLPPGYEHAAPARLAALVAATAHHEVHGTFVLVRGDAEAGLEDLSDEDVERWTRWFEVDEPVR